MDCSIQPLRHGLSLISTTDFFYPLVDDPYLQGIIGAANVLSDLYAMGVVNCDNMLMILSVSSALADHQKDIVTKKMIQGFNDTARKAETEVRGGQTVVNPWPIIGGVAMSTCMSDEFIYPTAGCVGNVIVLTKPLGTQVAVNLNEWLQETDLHYWNQVKDLISVKDVYNAYQCSVKSMCRLNRNAAKLMHKYKALGATDVTGFGILGHANNLASNQENSVDLEIHTLPIINHMAPISNRMGFFHLVEGFSAETSGGLFIMLPSENAAMEYCKEIEEIDGSPAWIIGRVVQAKDENTNRAYIKDNVKIIDVIF
jgi:selenide,water dikinase